MQRLTKLSDNKEFYVTDAITAELKNEGYYGDAIEKLAKFENLYQHLIARQKEIPDELERLRSIGKSKTVTFKELLTEKMVNGMILSQLERQDLK